MNNESFSRGSVIIDLKEVPSGHSRARTKVISPTCPSSNSEPQSCGAVARYISPMVGLFRQQYWDMATKVKSMQSSAYYEATRKQNFSRNVPLSGAIYSVVLRRLLESWRNGRLYSTSQLWSKVVTVDNSYLSEMTDPLVREMSTWNIGPTIKENIMLRTESIYSKVTASCKRIRRHAMAAVASRIYKFL